MRGDTYRVEKAFVIGLTGSLATGKSTVARMFRRLGARIIDSDKLAHQALNKGTRPYRRILKKFGSKVVLNRDGTLNRKRLAALVFGRPKKRLALEAIIHPFVFQKIREKLRGAPGGIQVLEVPLLFETHFDKHVDRVVVVTASRRNQLARAQKVLGLRPEEALQRIQSQRPLRWKEKRADFVIRNNDSLMATWRQVKRVWSQLKPSVWAKKKDSQGRG